MATKEGTECTKCIIGKTGGNPEDAATNDAFKPLNGMMSSITESQKKMVKEFTIDTQFKPITAFIELPAILASLPEKIPDDIPGIISTLQGEVTGTINDTFAMVNDMLAIVGDPVGGLKQLAFGPLFDNLELDHSISLKVPDFPSVPSFLVGLDFGEYGGSGEEDTSTSSGPTWKGSEAQEKFSKFAMVGMLPSMDPLFFGIKKIQDSVLDVVLKLPLTLEAAIAGPPAGLGKLISDVDKIVVTFEEIMQIIPPTNFIEEKLGGYFDDSGLQFPAELDFDMKGICVDCLMKQIPSLVI